MTLMGYRPNFSIYDSQDQASLLRETARELGMKGESVDLQAAAQLISSMKTGQGQVERGNQAPEAALQGVPEEPPALQRGGFRRPAHAAAGSAGRTPGDPGGIPRAVPLPPGGRVPGHLRGAVRPDEAPGRARRRMSAWSETTTSPSTPGAGPATRTSCASSSDFPRVREIKLEQNYRSTRTILKAANALISRNTNRKPKALWTGLPEGDPIELYSAETEIDEAEHVVSRIRTLMIRESLQLPGLRRAAQGQPPHARAGGGVPQGKHPLRRLGRHELLRAPGGARHARLPEADCQPRRRHEPPAHHQHPAPRHREEAPGARRRARRGASLLPVLRACRPRHAAGPRAGGEVHGAAAGVRRADRGVSRRSSSPAARWPQALRELVEEIDYWGHLALGEQGRQGQGRGEVEVRQRGVPHRLHCRLRGGPGRRCIPASSTTLRACPLPAATTWTPRRRAAGSTS